MFNIYDIVWFKCNFKTYGQSVINKLYSGKKVIDKDDFERNYGKITIEKCYFEGAYNDIISDTYKTNIIQNCWGNTNIFMTEDNTLWLTFTDNIHGDKWRVCGLLIAYVMSQICDKKEYKKIKRLGSINEFGCVDLVDVNTITDIMFNNVCRDIIGYLPNDNNSDWRKSKGTNPEKLIIIYEHYKHILPENCKPNIPVKNVLRIPNESLITLPSSIKNELSVIKRDEFSYRLGGFFEGANLVDYISDIHLDAEKINIFDIDNQLNSLCLKLAKSSENKIIIIAGDLCNNIEIAHRFYRKLRLSIAYFQVKNKKNYYHPNFFYYTGISKSDAIKEYRKEKKSLENDLLKSEKRLENIRKHFNIKSPMENIIKLYNYELEERKKVYEIAINEYRKILKIKDKLKRLKTQREVYIDNLQQNSKLGTSIKKNIFVVLGNHELSEFNTVEEAVEAYRTMLQKEHITLLQNEAKQIGTVAILGGIGFAKYNDKYNANSLIGAKTMTREDEINESELFNNIYIDCLDRAKEKDIPLIVVTHYPTKDWLLNNNLDSSCYYFYGHNHQNYINITNGINIYADNQIGYKNKKITFKQASIGTYKNPFIDYTDGCYIVSLSDYVKFMKYTGKNISGTSLIEKPLYKSDANLYMIKAAGYYGFFIIAPNENAKICYGGKAFNISHTKDKDINYFFQYFIIMVKLQLGTFTNYYNRLKLISSDIKNLGLSGRIHGCIVDIDDYNHIMINPLDNTITFYNSPEFGRIKTYDTFLSLLKDSINNALIDKVVTIDKIYQPQKNFNIPKSLLTQKELTELGFQKVPTNSGMYNISNKMNRVQYFLESGVLDTWNEQIIKDYISDIDLLDNSIYKITE